MAYVATDTTAGAVDFYQVDTLGPGPLAGLATGPTSRGFINFPGLELRAYDYNLGGGAFIYAKASGTITPGTVVELSDTVTNGRYDVTSTAWAGVANSGKTLAVALTTLLVNQFGWFQVEGNAMVTVQGAPVSGNSLYWQAPGIVSPTVVASKQVLNAVFGSAPAVVIGLGVQSLTPYSPSTTAQQAAGTLSATQAIVLLNRPSAQPQIT